MKKRRKKRVPEQNDTRALRNSVFRFTLDSNVKAVENVRLNATN